MVAIIIAIFSKMLFLPNIFPINAVANFLNINEEQLKSEYKLFRNYPEGGNVTVENGFRPKFALRRSSFRSAS